MSSIKKAPEGNHTRSQNGGRANPVQGCPLTAAQVMPGISQKVLTEQLRELVSDGVVHRQPKGAIPAPVEYSLTSYGRLALPLIEDVRRWGRAHLEHLESEADESQQTDGERIRAAAFGGVDDL